MTTSRSPGTRGRSTGGRSTMAVLLVVIAASAFLVLRDRPGSALLRDGDLQTPPFHGRWEGWSYYVVEPKTPYVIPVRCTVTSPYLRPYFEGEEPLAGGAELVDTTPEATRAWTRSRWISTRVAPPEPGAEPLRRESLGRLQVELAVAFAAGMPAFDHPVDLARTTARDHAYRFRGWWIEYTATGIPNLAVSVYFGPTVDGRYWVRVKNEGSLC